MTATATATNAVGVVVANDVRFAESCDPSWSRSKEQLPGDRLEVHPVPT
jgi:hypothetical protein